jgi:chromosomal replication initiation ATPase DnaA
MPFTDELNDIHRHDVTELLHIHKDVIKSKRARFEKYQVMNDLINLIQKEGEKNLGQESEREESEDEETTSPEDIEDFNNWAKNQALKELSKFKNLTDLSDIVELRGLISELNNQQRRIFDDFCERMVSTEINEPPVYLFIAGEAGTGKSHLVRLLIEAVKLIKIKAGDDIKKPPVLTMAPTGNAAFIIGGRTIDSALGFSPMESNRYVQNDPARMASMKYQYEDVEVMFIDEISMVGSMKLTKINYRLQDLADGDSKMKFMGGRSLVASGKFISIIVNWLIKY